jgi:hypothetical protein
VGSSLSAFGSDQIVNEIYSCSRLRLRELLDVLFALPAEVDHPFACQEGPIANRACRGRSRLCGER